MDLEEYIARQNDIKKEYDSLSDYIDIEKITSRVNYLEKEMLSDGFWDDNEKSKNVTKEISDLKDKLSEYNDIVRRYEDLDEYISMYKEGIIDSELKQEMDENISSLEKDIISFKSKQMLEGLDESDAFVTIHSGAGGTESCDFVEMLFRMYTRYLESSGYEVKLVDFLDGDITGYKSITFEVLGKYAASILESEKGVHRLVRISPFDSQKRRHTTFASVEVLPLIADEISVDINPKDLKIDTYRSSGAGGQHVNKTDSAVRVTHIPTGIVVTSQSQRSQMQNREEAMKILRSRLYDYYKDEENKKLSKITEDEKEISWGNQIRSYVFSPYTLVKDHRTGYTETNVEKVLNGDISNFIHHYLLIKR